MIICTDDNQIRIAKSNFRYGVKVSIFEWLKFAQNKSLRQGPLFAAS